MNKFSFMFLIILFSALFIMTTYASDGVIETVQSVETTIETVPVPTEVAPPEWVQNLILEGMKLPVVGPYITKALLYLGVIYSIITALVAFLLTSLSALSRVLTLAKLTQIALALQAFKDSKIMYYLKMFSMFPVKK